MSDQTFLERLDAAIGCMHCERPLPENAVSDYYCSQQCSEAFASERAPSGRSYDYFGDVDDYGRGWSAEDLADLEPVGWIAPPVWRLPRSTGDLEADKLAVDHALGLATTQAQRLACRLRLESLRERRWAVWAKNWRLPRSTGNYRADQNALAEAERTATTDAQRAACKLRRESLTERRKAMRKPEFPGFRAMWGFDVDASPLVHSRISWDRDPTSPTDFSNYAREHLSTLGVDSDFDATPFGSRAQNNLPGLRPSTFEMRGYYPSLRRPAISEGDTITITASSISGRYVVEGYNYDGSMRCRRMSEDDQPPILGAEATEAIIDETSPRERALRARRNRNTGPTPRPGRVRGNVPGARR